MSEMDPARLARLRTALGRKGMEINQKLTEVLAGMNVTLATMKLPNEEKPGEKPHERLRRFLDQIIRAQRRLGTAEFGKCQDCGQPLPDLALDESPWTEQCHDCFKKS